MIRRNMLWLLFFCLAGGLVLAGLGCSRSRDIGKPPGESAVSGSAVVTQQAEADLSSNSLVVTEIDSLLFRDAGRELVVLGHDRFVSRNRNLLIPFIYVLSVPGLGKLRERVWDPDTLFTDLIHPNDKQFVVYSAWNRQLVVVPLDDIPGVGGRPIGRVEDMNKQRQPSRTISLSEWSWGNLLSFGENRCVVSGEKGIVVIELETLTSRKLVDTAHPCVPLAAVTGDGCYLAAFSSRDGNLDSPMTLQTWRFDGTQATKPILEREYPAHSGLWRLAAAHDRPLFAVLLFGGDCELIDGSDGERPARKACLAETRDSVTDVLLFSASDKAVLRILEREIVVWDLTTDRVSRKALSGIVVETAAIDTTGQYIALGGDGGKVTLISLKDVMAPNAQ